MSSAELFVSQTAKGVQMKIITRTVESVARIEFRAETAKERVALTNLIRHLGHERALEVQLRVEGYGDDESDDDVDLDDDDSSVGSVTLETVDSEDEDA